MAQKTTRLAPSPTGALHLGNVRTFLINWALARQNDWKVLLRIDDLDGPRKKRGADQEAIEILIWLGIDWDEGPMYQSQNRDHYLSAFERLRGKGFLYPCVCTRREIEAASVSAPHGNELRYPGTCRTVPAALPSDTNKNRIATWRFKTQPGPVVVDDQFQGRHCFDPHREVGDFVIWTRGDDPAYQLAVVVDDSLSGVTHIVRGDDLASSTARQFQIARALDIEPPTGYFHLPLVVGRDGRRLAKRHGDTRVASLRRAGMSAQELIAKIARTCGIPLESGDLRLSAQDFVNGFDLQKLARAPLVYDVKTF